MSSERNEMALAALMLVSVIVGLALVAVAGIVWLGINT